MFDRYSFVCQAQMCNRRVVTRNFHQGSAICAKIAYTKSTGTFFTGGGRPTFVTPLCHRIFQGFQRIFHTFWLMQITIILVVTKGAVTPTRKSLKFLVKFLVKKIVQLCKKKHLLQVSCKIIKVSCKIIKDSCKIIKDSCISCQESWQENCTNWQFFSHYENASRIRIVILKGIYVMANFTRNSNNFVFI